MKFMEKAKRFFTLNAANHEGFTLVELIVVIAILAILAGVAVPAYSGYIKRAEKAADLQLLGAINEAYAAACMSEGVWETLDPNSAKMPIVNGKINLNGVAPVAVADDFAMFYMGNENAAFKVITALRFNPVSKVFEDAGEGAVVSLPGGGTISLTPDQLALLKGSTYANDISGLMTQVDGVSGLVMGLLVGENGDTSLAQAVLGDFLNSDAYLAGTIVALGGTVDPNKDLKTQYGDIVNQFKGEQVKKKLADELGVAVEDLDITANSERYNEIMGEVNATVDQNMLIMSVAQNASKQNAADVMKIINSDTPKADLLKAMTDGADGMGQAALVYGAFTAYAMSDSATEAAKQALADTSKEGGDPTAVFDVLTGAELEAFQAYMAKDAGKNDLNACIEAMGVINNTSNNKEASTGLMANGFANDDFVGALEELLK